MKKILIILIALTTTLVSMTVVADLYTKSQINNLIEDMCSYRPYTQATEYDYQKKKVTYTQDENYNAYYTRDIKPFNLVSLFNDSRRRISADYTYGGVFYEDGKNFRYYEIPIYVKWKTIIENNPELAYQALTIYGGHIVRQINSQLSYKHENRSWTSLKQEKFSDTRNPNWFSEKKFWNSNKKSIKQYQVLIDELLKLNDKDLNYFITTNDVSDAASHGFNSWLKEKELLNINNMGAYHYSYSQSANNYYTYPGDLLCLTKRVFERNPKWTPRKFLTEVNKFSNEVLEVIEDNN